MISASRSLVVCALSVAAVAAAQDGLGRVVAHVGSRVVLADDLRDVVVAQRQTGDSARVLESFTADGQRKLLQQIVDARLLALAARERGLDRDPAVQRAVDRAVDTVLSEHLVRREINALDLGDAALRRYYDAHQELFRTAARVRARHIVVAHETEAQRALAALKASADFGDLAGEQNIDASKAKRGELGWVTRGVMLKPFEDALFALRAGETSAVVQTRFGYHIIQAEEVDPGTRIAFEAVKDGVRQQIAGERIDALKRAVAARHPITIDEAVLKEALR